jgi:thiamine kinase-like enzyme
MLKSSVIINYLQQIFVDSSPSDFEFHRIGGMSNINYKVLFQDKTYILRIPGNGAEGMVERENEELNSQFAQKMGIHPEITYFNRTTGIKLVEYIEQAETLNPTTIQSQENLRQIADIYRTLHNSHIRERNDFNLFHEIDKYKFLMQRVGAKMYNHELDAYSQITALEYRLNKMGVEVKPCHNDGVPENFIKDKNGKMFLIDWEYSGMNDPIAELAALFLESNFSETSQNLFMSYYFKDNTPNDIQERLLIYQILWDYLWAQWTIIKEAKGDDFGEYGRMRFERAIKNLQLL